MAVDHGYGPGVAGRVSQQQGGTIPDRGRARVRRSGYPLAAPMQDRPWGLRDFRVADPDGYYLRITTPE
jgi:uncharacterized glyoxalase superfamily protein PhnB